MPCSTRIGTSVAMHSLLPEVISVSGENIPPHHLWAAATKAHETLLFDALLLYPTHHSPQRPPHLPLLHRPHPHPRQQIPPHSKHPSPHRGRKPIHLPCILLHLPTIDQALQPPRLRRQLEDALPLVLGQGRLLGEHAACVLGLALLLPGGDLGLFARELALVELVVVELGVVRLDAFEEVLGGL